MLKQLKTPFNMNETKADHAKDEMQTEMKDLYLKIYELGSPETRELFKELGIDSL
ncbi:hypothetical protein ACE1TI_19740 [Alteribacillus sp. JSM 102045]|uniref:hypothetical protein n=1 Tax=Alteribacillus sp. JSM 102045 TaxID=1562101 RepID=UPI0035C18E77